MITRKPIYNSCACDETGYPMEYRCQCCQHEAVPWWQRDASAPIVLATLALVGIAALTLYCAFVAS